MRWFILPLASPRRRWRFREKTLILERRAQPEAAGDQLRQFMQRHHVWAVAQGLVGVGMRFQKHTVAAASHRRPRQERHEAALAAGAVTQRGWLLYAVGRVED